MVKKKKTETDATDDAVTGENQALEAPADAVHPDHPVNTLAARIEELRRAQEMLPGADKPPAGFPVQVDPTKANIVKSTRNSQKVSASSNIVSSRPSQPITQATVARVTTMPNQIIVKPINKK